MPERLVNDLIDAEIAATVRTWEDQQQLRGRILDRVHRLAGRCTRPIRLDPPAAAGYEVPSERPAAAPDA